MRAFSSAVTGVPASDAVWRIASCSAPYSRTMLSTLNPSRSRWIPCSAAVRRTAGSEGSMSLC